MPFPKLPKSSRDFLRDPNSAAEMFREIARQQSRSLEMVHKHLHSLNSFSELKRKIAAIETSSFAKSYQSAVTLAKFYNAGITRNSVQDFLQRQDSLSEQVEKLIKTSEFLATHNIFIPASPVDILNTWLDEQSEQNEKSVLHCMVFLTESVSDKKKLPSFDFKIKVHNWISNILAILALAQSCTNEANTEKANHMLEEALVVVSEQTAGNENLILALGNELAKQNAEDRAFFLSAVREEVQRIQDELDDKASSESDEEMD